jgi:hypothetical protein
LKLRGPVLSITEHFVEIFSGKKVVEDMPTAARSQCETRLYEGKGGILHKNLKEKVDNKERVYRAWMIVWEGPREH